MAVDIIRKITKEFVLEQVSEEEIFHKYLGYVPEENKQFRNPFRTDNSPGCVFYIDKRGVWKFADKSRGFNWDCFNVVEVRFNLNFKQALLKIAEDFRLLESARAKASYAQKQALRDTFNEAKQLDSIRIQKKQYDKDTLKYWEQYTIRFNRLIKFRCFPLKAFWINGVLRYLDNIDKDLCYAYDFLGYDYKIYLPERKKPQPRFYQSCNLLQGIHQLKGRQDEPLIITKSYKDVMAFDIFNIAAVAPMSESIIISDEDFKDLYNRFSDIHVVFDNDEAGRVCAERYKKQFGDAIAVKFVQKHKDFSDYIKHEGREKAKKECYRLLY